MLGTPLDRAAQHMAGHAVSRVLFKWRFTRIALDSGSCLHCLPPKSRTPTRSVSSPAQAAWRTAVTCFAGPEAAWTLGKDPGSREGILAQNRIVAPVLAPFAHNDRELAGRIGQCRKAARQLIVDNEAAVRSIARWLFGRGVITWKQAGKAVSKRFPAYPKLGPGHDHLNFPEATVLGADQFVYVNPTCANCGQSLTLCPDCGLCTGCCVCML